LIGLVLGAAVGGALLVYRGERLENEGHEPVDSLPSATDTLPAGGVTPVTGGDGGGLRPGRDNAIVQATERVAPTVVTVNVLHAQVHRSPAVEFLERQGLIPPQSQRSATNMGSGVIVSSDGMIVTNWHVVSGAEQIMITLSDGRRYQAVLVEEVERYDLAVLRIDGRDLPAAPLAAAADPKIGEWAIAIGSPFGYLLADTQPTVTVGVISAVNRDIRRGQDDRSYLGMIQTDAAINPGNSGGPLVNTAGEVIGINTFIFSESGGSVGIGFAVPVHRVRTVLDEIQRYGHYRDISLGLSLRNLDRRVMSVLGTSNPIGVAVAVVVTDGAAWLAGLRSMDIIRQINGEAAVSISMVERLVYNSAVGDHLTFLADRDGQLWEGEIVIEEQR